MPNCLVTTFNTCSSISAFIGTDDHPNCTAWVHKWGRSWTYTVISQLQLPFVQMHPGHGGQEILPQAVQGKNHWSQRHVAGLHQTQNIGLCYTHNLPCRVEAAWFPLPLLNPNFPSKNEELFGLYVSAFQMFQQYCLIPRIWIPDPIPTWSRCPAGRAWHIMPA